MNKIKRVEPTVEKVLREVPEARSDDFVLVLEVYHRFDSTISAHCFADVMLHHREYGLPYFESVRRCRQKLQAKYEELKPAKEVTDARYEEEKEYVDYSRE